MADTTMGNSPAGLRSGRIIPAVAVLVAVAAAWMLWGYLSKPVAVFDYEIYGAVSDLAADSEVVIAGTIDGEIASWIDRGGDPEVIDSKSIEGNPMVLLSVTVEESIKGAPAGVVVVARPDLSKLRSSSLAPLETGSRVVLFLSYVTRDRAPDIPAGYEGVWVVVGGDGGVFDLNGAMATPRIGPMTLVRLGDTATSFEMPDLADAI